MIEIGCFYIDIMFLEKINLNTINELKDEYNYKKLEYKYHLNHKRIDYSIHNLMVNQKLVHNL